MQRKHPNPKTVPLNLSCGSSQSTAPARFAPTSALGSSRQCAAMPQLSAMAPVGAVFRADGQNTRDGARSVSEGNLSLADASGSEEFGLLALMWTAVAGTL